MKAANRSQGEADASLAVPSMGDGCVIDLQLEDGSTERIAHIGSTAIPGMASKDVLDIQMSVCDLDAAVRTEHLTTPADWARQGLARGTPFSLAHTFAQTGPFRPRNTVPGLANVALAGCGTTPGVGLPTVLISGKLAAARVAARTEGRR
jgi:phytoene dehydrogenase-like protein